ncbi:hypothetical protein PO909_018756 [Leuciscus waleckii]
MMNLLYILLLVLWSAFNSTSSFLIYNKAHNKCVYAVSATVVLTEACNASFTAQHFQWISSSQIISLAFSLCLGAEKIEDRSKVILLPCNESNPRQTWECNDETLFGLKGYPLHLNYRNDEQNVMLFTGTGVWSRWRIFGTDGNLCSHGYQVSSVVVKSPTVESESKSESPKKSPSRGRVETPLPEFESESSLESPVFESESSHQDHREEGVSLFYICYSSCIAVGLVIMTVAVIVTTIRSKKDSINPTTTVPDNDYMDA